MTDQSLPQLVASVRAAANRMLAECDTLDTSLTAIRGKVAGKPDRQIAVNASATAPASPPNPKPRRELSAAARKRISVAQKKRWAEHHKRQAATTTSKPKVKAAGR